MPTTSEQHHSQVIRLTQARLLPGNPILASIVALVRPKRQGHPILLRWNQPCCQTSNLHGLQDSFMLCKWRPWATDCRMGHHDGSSAQP